MGKETRNKTPRQEHELEKEIPVEQEEVQDQDTGQSEEETAAPPKSEQELLQEKYDQLQDQHLRLMAEYDNYRKRTQKEKDDIYQAATAATLQKILPMQDNFDRASAFECHTEEFAKGFALIEKPSGKWETPSTRSCTTPSCISRTKALGKMLSPKCCKRDTEWEIKFCATPWYRQPTSRQTGVYAPLNRMKSTSRSIRRKTLWEKL